jgi:hypothetical protein
MRWSWRKSKSFGPLRFNLSRRGVGVSLGGRWLRVGRRADGDAVVGVGVPGTGLRGEHRIGKEEGA